jgi:general secretion pathway protein C
LRVPLNHNRRMLARLSAFVIWALVAATAVFWGLRLFVHAPAAPSYAVAVGDATAVRSDLTRLLGAPPVATTAAAAAPESSSRFRLLGIVAPKYPTETAVTGHGVALIAIDGKMPKAFSVGSRVDGDLVLQSVSLRTVSIGADKGPPGITLELPLLTPAATGTLPAGGTGSGIALPTGAPVPQYSPSPQFPPNFTPPGMQQIPQMPVKQVAPQQPNAQAQ